MFSLIIPTYNRALSLKATIQSILNTTDIVLVGEILVVDNASVDNTKEIVNDFKKCGVCKIRYVFEPRQGVHFARNSVVSIAKHELLYYTDDDMEFTNGFLLNINELFELDNKIGVIGGRVMEHFLADAPNWIRKYCLNSLLSINNPNYDLLISNKIIGIWSCHMAIRKSVLIEAGGFNPENRKGVWVGDGESGLNIKVKNLEWKFGFIGTSLVYHMIPESRLCWRYIWKRQKNQGYSDSYTQLRARKGNVYYLIFSIFSKGYRLLIILIKITLTIYNRDKFLFKSTEIGYYYALILSKLKFLFNSEFRKYALRYDYLNE